MIIKISKDNLITGQTNLTFPTLSDHLSESGRMKWRQILSWSKPNHDFSPFPSEVLIKVVHERARTQRTCPKVGNPTYSKQCYNHRWMASPKATIFKNLCISGDLHVKRIRINMTFLVKLLHKDWLIWFYTSILRTWILLNITSSLRNCGKSQV